MPRERSALPRRSRPGRIGQRAALGRADRAQAASLALRRRRRGLPLEARNGRIDAGPARRLRGPDGAGWTGELRIIERADAHEDQLRAGLRGAEQVHAALRTEAPMHRIAAVGDAAVVASLAVDREARGREGAVDRAAPATDVLAQAAPAGAGSDWGSRAGVA